MSSILNPRFCYYDRDGIYRGTLGLWYYATELDCLYYKQFIEMHDMLNHPEKAVREMSKSILEFFEVFSFPKFAKERYMSTVVQSAKICRQEVPIVCDTAMYTHQAKIQIYEKVEEESLMDRGLQEMVEEVKSKEEEVFVSDVDRGFLSVKVPCIGLNCTQEGPAYILTVFGGRPIRDGDYVRTRDVPVRYDSIKPLLLKSRISMYNLIKDFMGSVCDSSDFELWFLEGWCRNGSYDYSRQLFSFGSFNVFKLDTSFDIDKCFLQASELYWFKFRDDYPAKSVKRTGVLLAVAALLRAYYGSGLSVEKSKKYALNYRFYSDDYGFKMEGLGEIGYLSTRQMKTKIRLYGFNTVDVYERVYLRSIMESLGFIGDLVDDPREPFKFWFSERSVAFLNGATNYSDNYLHSDMMETLRDSMIDYIKLSECLYADIFFLVRFVDLIGDFTNVDYYIYDALSFSSYDTSFMSEFYLFAEAFRNFMWKMRQFVKLRGFRESRSEHYAFVRDELKSNGLDPFMSVSQVGDEVFVIKVFEMIDALDVLFERFKMPDDDELGGVD